MVTARIAGFSPGTSPPPVRIPITPFLVAMLDILHLTLRDFQQVQIAPRTHLTNRERVRCWRFGAGARREEGEYPLWIFDQRATPLQRQRSATLRANLWRAAGCVAPQSQSTSAMLLRRALPAARQSLVHSFPIYKMG